MRCSEIIPDTFTICGEGDQFCSSECMVRCQLLKMTHENFALDQKARRHKKAAQLWKQAAKRFWSNWGYCSKLSDRRYRDVELWSETANSGFFLLMEQLNDAQAEELRRSCGMSKPSMERWRTGVNAPHPIMRKHVHDQIRMLLSNSNSSSNIIKSMRVVSPPGSHVTVTEIELTDSARESLMIGSLDSFAIERDLEHYSLFEYPRMKRIIDAVTKWVRSAYAKTTNLF